MSKTKIDWADKVWNPVTGCTKVSSGCKNCYAERVAKRFWRDGIIGDNYRPFSEVRCHTERLEQPLHWNKPARIFVDSMGDLFHKDVPNTFISQVFWIMEMAPMHTFMILTKRPKRMLEWVNQDYQNPLPNVWLGVSAEDQKTADEKIPILLEMPAVVRFVSVEPMLGKIDIWQYLGGNRNPIGEIFNNKGLDWIICGCESGPGARPMKMSWAADLKHQCVFASVPFFFKQAMIEGKLVKMPKLDGKIWDEMPGIIAVKQA
jgi:protein gp37